LKTINYTVPITEKQRLSPQAKKEVIKNSLRIDKGDSPLFLSEQVLGGGSSLSENISLRFNSQGVFKALGQAECNADSVEMVTGARIFVKEGSVIVKSRGSEEDERRITMFMDSLSQLGSRGIELSRRDMSTLFSQCTDEKSCSEAVELFTHKTVIARSGKRVFHAKSASQKYYYEAIQANDVIFGVGPAGTGKTFVPIIDAASKLKNGDIRKIILTRPIVEAEEKLGYLPGNMKEKVDPYLRPLYDGLEEVFAKDEIEKMIHIGVIEIAPLAFMRGRTLEDAYVILDEAQNTTPGQMKLFLTRLGFRSKMVITGDITQVDLPKHVKSGLRQAIETLRGVNRVKVVLFENKDIVRHPIVQRIVEKFDEKEEF
jgi:phosphate starvation-inducible protein PhoH and related proteins